MVRNSLKFVAGLMDAASDNDVKSMAEKIGVCADNIPSFASSTMQNFKDEIMMVVGYTFANYNMGNYPPDKTTDLFHTCVLFQDMGVEAVDKVARLLNGLNEDDSAECFDMNTQVPSGDNPTITSGDWSGVGTGGDGEMWDFQTCSYLVETIGFSGKSDMFPARPWTMDWLNSHCGDRFDVKPNPSQYANDWGFDDIIKNTDVSRVLFTNGLNDGWSVGSICETLDAGDRQLIAMNFPNGAHHSDLSHSAPGLNDTPDIQEGHAAIIQLFHKWFKDIKEENI